MTWSLVQKITTTASTLNKAELEAPWVYFFETFLPTRGYSVSPGEFGGATLNSSTEIAWGVSKSHTLADGSSYLMNRIFELEFNVTDAMTWYWSGVPGEGLGSSQFNDTSWTRALGTGTRNFHIFASDEHDDAYCVFAGRHLVAWSHPIEGVFLPSYDDQNAVAQYMGALFTYEEPSNGDYLTSSSTSALYAGLGSTTRYTGYLMTPAFSYFQSTPGAAVYGQNVVPDTYLRITNTSSSYSRITARYPSSVLIDVEYYLDLYPQNNCGLMLNCGANDYGVLD